MKFTINGSDQSPTTELRVYETGGVEDPNCHMCEKVVSNGEEEFFQKSCIEWGGRAPPKKQKKGKTDCKQLLFWIPRHFPRVCRLRLKDPRNLGFFIALHTGQIRGFFDATQIHMIDLVWEMILIFGCLDLLRTLIWMQFQCM